MKTVTEHIRDHLWKSLVPERLPELSELQETEWCPEFEQLMRNRLIMGRIRYGQSLQDKEKGVYDCLKAIERKVIAFRNTGNTEYLVDVANYCLIEFMHSTHPHKHFGPTDDADHCPIKSDL